MPIKRRGWVYAKEAGTWSNGNYSVWIQGHVRYGKLYEKEWAAARIHGDRVEILSEREVCRVYAMKTCEDDSKKKHEALKGGGDA